MKYYITGGLGVIGSCFAKHVLEQGHEVVILDAAEEDRNKWMANYLTSNYKNVKIFMERMETSKFKELEACDFILHAAAHTGIPHSVIDPVDDWLSNAEASRNLFEHLRKLDKKIPTVSLSSVKPYRVHDLPYRVSDHGTRYVWEDDNRVGISEKHLLEPDEPYAASKMAQSALCMAYARSYDLPITVFRCSNLYGAAPSHGPRHGWLTWFCLSAVLGRYIEVQGTGLQVRDMLFSDDVNSAVLSAFNNIQNCQGNVFNVGGGAKNSVSVIEAVRLIEEVHGKVNIKYGQGRKHEDLIFITDYSKFNQSTAWEPQVNVVDGIAKILAWAERNKEAVQKMYDGV